MADSDLKEELLRQGGLSGPAPAGPATDAHQLLRRARRRTRFLAVLATLLWLLTATGVIIWAVGFAVFFLPRLSYLAAQVAFVREFETAQGPQPTSLATTSEGPAGRRDEQPVSEGIRHSPDSRPYGGECGRAVVRPFDANLERERSSRDIWAVGMYIHCGGIALGVLLALSGASTIGFVLSSRQATLRQIHLSLQEIMAEIKRAH